MTQESRALCKTKTTYTILKKKKGQLELDWTHFISFQKGQTLI